MKPIRSMLPGPWSALLVSGACLFGASSTARALEGDLPSRNKDAVTQGSWTENCAGSWPVKDIVRDYNRWDKIKIGIDSRLALGKTLTDWKTENITVLASVEALAKKLGANVYVIRDFLYIATEVPDGVAIAGGGHRTPAPAAAPDKPPDPPKKEDPPPPPGPPKGGGDKGDKPPNDKKTQKPPPNATNKPPPPPVGEKALPALKAVTPGSGLAELPAIFPGVRPGTSATIPWSHKSMKDCVAEGKPIILLAYFAPANPKTLTPEETKLQAKYDKDPKDVAGYLETLILEDPQVVSELRGGFNFICIPWNEPADSWPAAYTEATKPDGAAMFVIPKDGSRPVLAWAGRSPAYTAAELIKAAKPLLGAGAGPAVAAVKPPAKPDEPKKPELPKIDPPKKVVKEGVKDE